MGLTLVKNENDPEQVTFEDFWASYPRRQKRKDAEAAWKRIDPRKRSAILKGVEAWKRSEQWNRDGGQYIPLPTSFLNGERWEDEVEISVCAVPCQWPKCKGSGTQKWGSRDYCEAHLGALKRGETP